MGTSVSPWSKTDPEQWNNRAKVAEDVKVGWCRLTLSNPR